MNLTIHEYELSYFPNEEIIISKKGIMKINSPKLLKLLERLKKTKRTVIKKQILDNMLKRLDLDPHETFNYLENIAVVTKIEGDIYFENIIIAHDWHDATEIESVMISEIKSPFEIHKISRLLVTLSNKNRCFINIVCTQYNYAELKSLYFSIAAASPRSAICISYFSESHFCISQPYIPVVGNPCHFCNIDRAIDYENRRSSYSNWWKLLSFFKDRNTSMPRKKLTLLQRNFALGAVAKKINLHTQRRGENFRHQDSALMSMSIDLNNGLIREESIPHWLMCDCLGNTNENHTT